MIELSPTRLNLFVECKRCFWLRVNRDAERPESGFPSAVGEFDRDLKAHFDTYRRAGRVPPSLRSADVDERLVTDTDFVSRCRAWQREPQYSDPSVGATLVGGLDDLLVAPDGSLVVLDYKTRASFPDVPHGHYRRQLALYTLLLDESGHQTTDYGALLYFAPSGIAAGGDLRFQTELRRVPVAVEAVRGLFERAAEVARDSIPPPDADCQFCGWSKQNAGEAAFDSGLQR